MGDHEYFAGLRVSGYAGDKPVGVEFRGKRAALLDILRWTGGDNFTGLI